MDLSKKLMRRETAGLPFKDGIFYSSRMRNNGAESFKLGYLETHGYLRLFCDESTNNMLINVC